MKLPGPKEEAYLKEAFLAIVTELRSRGFEDELIAGLLLGAGVAFVHHLGAPESVIHDAVRRQYDTTLPS